MKTIAELLAYGQEHLTSLENPRLEAQILLAHVLACERSTLYAWPEKEVAAIQIKAFFALLERRKQGEPIAYLLKYKEFWSQNFIVTPDTLIPRPETELLIEKVLTLLPENPLALVDLGTGSGIIACTLALLRPQWQITAIDICPRALTVAQQNASQLGIKNIDFYASNWLQTLSVKRFAAIVSNPPYLKVGDPHLVNLTYEPYQALVAGPTGFEAFNTIITQAQNYLLPGGYLVFEHGFDQGARVKELMLQANFIEVNTFADLTGCERVSLGKVNNHH